MEYQFETIKSTLELISERVNAIGEKLVVLEKQNSEYQEVGGVELPMEMTGMSRSAIYAHTSKKTIPFHKPPGSKKLIFYRSELTNWIKNQQQKG